MPLLPVQFPPAHPALYFANLNCPLTPCGALSISFHFCSFGIGLLPTVTLYQSFTRCLVFHFVSVLITTQKRSCHFYDLQLRIVQVQPTSLDAAKIFVELLLEYVLNNHLIKRELTMLQAFQISLCWTAASLLKQKVNHKESLACAKKHLNFNCNKDEVDYVYAMLQCLKSTAYFKAAESPKFAESSCRCPLKDHSDAKVSHSVTCKFHKVTSENGDLSLNQEYIAQKDVSKSIKQIQKKFQKKMKKFNDKQLKERSEILRSYKEEKENLEFKHKIESIVIRTCLWRNILLKKGKPKMWEIEQEKEVEDHKHQMEMRLEHLKKLQLEAASKVKKKEDTWVEELKRWAHDELFYRPSLDAPESAHSMTGGVMELSKTADYVTDKAVACSRPITATTPAWSISANSALDTMTYEAGLFTDVMGKNNSGKSCHDQENFVSVNSGAKNFITIGGTSDNAEVLLEVTEICSTAALTEAITSSLPSFDECLHNTNPLPIFDAVVRLEVAETVNSVDGPQRPLLLNLTSLEQNPNGAAVSVPDSEAPVGLHETISTGHDLCNVASEIPPSCEEQAHVISPVTMQDKEAETGVHVMLDDDLENLVAMDLPSSEEQISKSATEKENSQVHETISSSHDLHNVVSVIPPSSEGRNLMMSLATVQGKEAEAGVLDKESNDYASLGEDQGNLVDVHSSSSEETITESTSGKLNSEAQILASDSATQVNQQNLVDSAVNGNSYQEMPLDSSPSVQPQIALVLGGSLTAHQADQDHGTDMLATSSAAQDGDAQACGNQDTCQPMDSHFHNGIEFQPSSEDSDFNQVTHVAMQFNANLPAFSEQTDRRSTFVTSNLPLPFNCDLLQNELERLGREREENLKSHENKKLQLKSDMEKGIEELKAEICQEYETELQQIEAEFFLKKEDLLAVHKKVLIHMMLARAWDLAFKSIGKDNTGSSSSGVHHDGNFAVDRQLVQSCMQQNAQMPSLVSNSSLANPPAACGQTTPLALATSPHYAAPLIQNDDLLPTPSPGLSSTNAASHPRIGSFSFSTGRPQGRVEIRSPLPHLQPRRPSTPFTGGTSPFTHEDGSSNQQSHRSSPSLSLLELFLTQIPAPTQITVPYNMGHYHETAGEPSISVTGTSPVYPQCEVISNQQPHRNFPPSLSSHTQRPLASTQQFDLLPTPPPGLSSTNAASHPHIGSFSSLTGIPQGRVEIRSPLPHLQPRRPSTPLTGGASPSSHEDGSSNQQSHRSSPSSPLLELFLTQPPAPTQMSVPYNMEHDHETAGEPSISVTGTGLVYPQCEVISNQQPHRNSPPSPPLLSSHTQRPLASTRQFDLLRTPSPGLSSTNAASHPHFGSFSSSTGRPQGRVEICAPLPHLQPRRLSTPFTGGTSPFCHEDGSSNQQSHRNSLSSSLLELFLTQPPAPTRMSVPYNMEHDHETAEEPSISVTGTSPVYQQCGVISNQQPDRNSPPAPPLLSPHTQRPLVPTQQFVPDNIVHHRESAGGLPALRSASALELLIDMSNQSSSSWRSTQNSSRLEPSGGSTDVVCLSDDD
ncbi:helicase protein MOM1-like isoform X3 [Rosa rugosa]|uniref:helicase protein MOM1-like isoform X3 n=1 Tax=Rosa rugosa TaxID=74645 RepID=UPI002B40164A|nr:helicase protein MOM1-like isoform X3 [Rosa rugosa]